MNVNRKRILFVIDSENRLDITIIKERGRFFRFAINYSARIRGRWVAVYRADNHHGFVHEQRLWKGKEPIPLREYEGWELKDVSDDLVEKVKRNHDKSRKLYEARN